MSYLLQFTCSRCQKIYNTTVENYSCSECGSVLLAEYDLYRARREGYEVRRQKGQDIWMFREMLPIRSDEQPITFHEGMTPVLSAPRLAETLNIPNIFIKNEALNPTGSLRDREMSALFSFLQGKQVQQFLVDELGNLSISASAYSRKLQKSTAVLLPRGIPAQFIGECQLYSARVKLIPWQAHNTREIKQQFEAQPGMFLIRDHGATFRIEGAKTIFYEIWNQLNKNAFPDVIIIPTGEGITLLGFWKAFQELIQLGEIKKSELPKIWLVQSSECSPILAAMANENLMENLTKDSIAFDLNIQQPMLLELLVKIVQTNEWLVGSVTDEEILLALKEFAQTEGLLLSPEGSAALAFLKKMVLSGLENSNQTFLILNPATGTRYIHSIGFIDKMKTN